MKIDFVLEASAEVTLSMQRVTQFLATEAFCSDTATAVKVVFSSIPEMRNKARLRPTGTGFDMEF